MYLCFLLFCFNFVYKVLVVFCSDFLLHSVVFGLFLLFSSSSARSFITFYTGHVITSYSNINETATKTKYNKNIVKPKPLFMRQRKQAIDITTNINIINNIVMEQTIPTEFTSTGAS